MSYLVLARKYRPTTFSEVVGQEHVTRTLANAFAKDRVHHAFLFCGPRGVGKTTLARILGKSLNCEKGPSAQPCGACSACESIANGSSVDYFEMDGASNRGIDSIRDLTEAVRYQPAMLRKKVYVIDEVHMLTTEAFNALLKTLEEPPSHVSFVLATTEPHKVPNTILSRCQRYDFKLVPVSILGAHMTRIFAAESLAIEPGAIALIARESGGSVRDALSLCDQVISYVGSGTITESAVAEVLGVADRALTRSLVTALATGDAGSALEAAARAIERGVDEVQLARAIVRYLRDLAVAQVASASEVLIEGSVEERAELAEQARSLDRMRVLQMFDRMIRACDDLGETQQPRLVLDLALIDVAALEPLEPLGGLLDRLADLERRLGSGSGSSGGPVRRGSPAPAQGARRSGPMAAPAGEQARAGEQASPAERTSTERPATDALAVSPPFAAGSGPGLETSADVARRARQLAAQSDSPPLAAPAEPPARPPASEPRPSEPQPSATAATRSPAASETAARPGSTAPPPRPDFKPPDDALGEWERVLEAFADDEKIAASIYEHGKLLSWDAHGITLGFAAEGGTLGMARDYLDAIKSFLRHRYGQPVAVELRPFTAEEALAIQSARSILELEQQRAEDRRQKRIAEVHEHPIYIKVLDTLGTPTREEIQIDV